MPSVLKRIDNQLSLTLPEDLARAAGLQEGAQVEVRVDGRTLVVRRRKANLQALLDQVEGTPPPMVWDDLEPRGSDVW